MLKSDVQKKGKGILKMKTTQFKSKVSYVEHELSLADVLKAFNFPEGTKVFLRIPDGGSLELGKNIDVLYVREMEK